MSLHFRLNHLPFLDWDVLPRRRAAMLAPRAAWTLLMIVERMERGRIATGVPLPPATPALRVLFDVMMCTTKDFNTIFREYVWSSVMAPPDLVERGRVEDAKKAREAVEAEAAATAVEAAAAQRRSSGGRCGKKKKKKKGKKGRC